MAMRMLAKLFHAEHQVKSAIAAGWSVQKMDNTYRLTGPAQEVVDAKPGDTLTDGQIFAQRDGLFYLGENMIVSPLTHWEGFEARPARGKGKFFIDRPGKNPLPATVGEPVGALRATLERGPHGHLVLNGRVVLEVKKVRELSLVVFDKELGKGHMAFFNVLGEGKRDAPVGTRGIFVRDAKGACFKELGGDDMWHDTARFYDQSNNFVDSALRTLNDAERSAVVGRDLLGLEKEAKRIGVRVTDLEEYDGLIAERDATSSTWKRHRFVIADGRDWVVTNTRAIEAPSP